MRDILRLVLLNVASATIIFVFTMLSYKNIKDNAKTVHVRDYKHFNEIEFMSDLRCSMLEQNRCQDTLDKSRENFKESFMEISNKHAPIKSHRVRDRIIPWANRDIINMMYERDYIHK